MTVTNLKTRRLSIDLPEDEHRIIKANAATSGQSIRQYILDSVRERLRQENENKHLSSLTNNISPVLQDLWDNKRDSIYDEI